jgi:hypothetical protein
MAERGRIEMVGRDGDMVVTFGQTLLIDHRNLRGPRAVAQRLDGPE